MAILFHLFGLRVFVKRSVKNVHHGHFNKEENYYTYSWIRQLLLNDQICIYKEHYSMIKVEAKPWCNGIMLLQYWNIVKLYNLTGHVITGDLNIINYTSQWDVLAKQPIYREPKSINLKHNFKIRIDSMED